MQVCEITWEYALHAAVIILENGDIYDYSESLQIHV